MGNPTLTELSDKDHWRTPEWLYGMVEDTVGIDLDPCAGEETWIADTNWYIGRGEDGLDRSWAGYEVVFVNPPFSEKQQWLQKAVTEFEDSRSKSSQSVSASQIREMDGTELIVVVTPDSTDVKSWFHGLIVPNASYVWFSEGRVSYIDPETGEPAGSPSFNTCLSLFGEVPRDLRETLQTAGWLVPNSQVSLA